VSSTPDAGTARAEALAALGPLLDDPSVLEGVQARDFDADHAFDDDSRGPALRVAGVSGGDAWLRLDDRAGRALAAYVEAFRLGPGGYLFATDDVRADEPPGARDPRGR
jgi:hypothetical protein